MRRRYLVAYQSRKGNTLDMAKEISKTLENDPKNDVTCIHIKEVKIEDIRLHEVLVIGTPCYFDSYAGAIQDCFEEIYEELEDEIDEKLGAIFSSAAEDASGACNALKTLLEKMGLKVFGAFAIRLSSSEEFTWRAECNHFAENLVNWVNLNG